MKKLVCSTVALLVIFGSVSIPFAEIREEESQKAGSGLQNVHERVLCVDGLKVFQTIVFGFKGDGGAGVSSIQLMEEKDGRLVPVRCSE